MRTTLFIAAAATLALAGCQREEADPATPGGGSGIKPVDAVPLPDDMVVMHPNDMTAAAPPKAKPTPAAKEEAPEAEEGRAADATPPAATPTTPPAKSEPEVEPPAPDQAPDPRGE